MSRKTVQKLAAMGAIATLGLTACAAGGSAGEGGSGAELRLGHIYASTSTQNEGALLFAELVEEKTGGAYTVSVFPDGQLGGDEALGQDLSRGALDFSFLGVGSMSGTDPLLDFHYLPYITTNYEQVDELYFGDGIIPTTLESALEGQNIVPLGIYEVEYRSVTNSQHPVESVDDLQGLKLRVPGSEAIRSFFDEAGAQTVVMPFPELLSAIEQKTVDGQDNGLQLTNDSGLTSAQPYITLTNHVMATGYISAGQQTWDGLSPEHQDAVREAAQEAQEFQVAASRERTAQYVEQLRAEGIDVIELSDAQLKEFQTFGISLWPDLESIYGADRIAELKAEVEALQ